MQVLKRMIKCCSMMNCHTQVRDGNTHHVTGVRVRDCRGKVQSSKLMTQTRLFNWTVIKGILTTEPLL